MLMEMEFSKAGLKRWTEAQGVAFLGYYILHKVMMLKYSAQGDENTAKILNIIEDSLTIEQRNMVQARAAKFKPRTS